MDNNRIYERFPGTSECQDIMTKLRRLDFVILETTLYLDVYPECTAAQEYLEARRAERVDTAAEYEAKCGMLTMYGVCGESGARGPRPWPWEYAAN